LSHGRNVHERRKRRKTRAGAQLHDGRGAGLTPFEPVP
jgi:hypothetical protein